MTPAISSRTVIQIFTGFVIALACGFAINTHSAWAAEDSGASTDNLDALVQSGVIESDPSTQPEGSQQDVAKSTFNDGVIQPPSEISAFTAAAQPAPLPDGDYAIRANTATISVLDIAGAGSADGTNAQAYAANGTAAQRWSLRANPDGTVTALSKANGLALDISGASRADGANVQIYTAYGTGAQAFVVKSKGGNCYEITNALTGKAVDVSAGSAANGANVQQYTSNGTNAQLWKAEFSDAGYITFTNVGSGKVLDVLEGNTADGANVQQYVSNGTRAQGWRVSFSSYKPDTVLQNAYSWVQNYSSETNYFIVVDLANTRTMIFEGSAGDWTPIKNWTVSVGAPGSPTVTGHYTVGLRGYSFGHGYTCYYWTQFYGDYLFHSVLYNERTFTIQDGRLGYHISAGCVRMNINDAKWIYDNIPSSTHVYVHN